LAQCFGSELGWREPDLGVKAWWVEQSTDSAMSLAYFQSCLVGGLTVAHELAANGS
jgi:hypothetical protein